MALLAVLGLLMSLWAMDSFQLRSPRARPRQDVQMLQDGFEESKRGARVPIEKIPSMFDDGAILPGINGPIADGGKSQYYDDEDDDEESEEEEQEKFSPVADERIEEPVGAEVDKEVMVQRIIIEPISPPFPRSESAFDIGDLVAMETQAKLEGSGALNEDNSEEEDVVVTDSVNSSVGYDGSTEDAGNAAMEDDYDISLEKALDSKRAATVRRSMSIKSSTAVRAGEQVRRVTKYDPKEMYRPDPMKYGAYRRWQVDNDEDNDSRKASVGGKSGTKSGGRGTGKKGKVEGQKGPKKGGDTNSFYKAIKKLGSGPKGEGESTGTGVADPDKGMKNVDLGKPPPRTRRTKRTVTAQDIDSIFDASSAGGEEDEYGDGDGYTDAEDDYEETEVAEGVVSKAPTPVDVASLNSFFDEPAPTKASSTGVSMTSSEDALSLESLTNDEVPKWLKEADKDAKKALRAKGKKKKKLTDDWRFWAAIIASVGFVSAYFTTRGSNTNINSANPIERLQQQQQPSGGGFLNKNRGEPDELVI